MQIAVMGAGSIGGYFGGMLARAGHRVTLIARGQHLAAIREQGLKIQTDAELLTIPCGGELQATDNPASAEVAELIPADGQDLPERCGPAGYAADGRPPNYRPVPAKTALTATAGPVKPWGRTRYCPAPPTSRLPGLEPGVIPAKRQRGTHRLWRTRRQRIGAGRENPGCPNPKPA